MKLKHLPDLKLDALFDFQLAITKKPFSFLSTKSSFFANLGNKSIAFLTLMIANINGIIPVWHSVISELIHCAEIFQFLYPAVLYSFCLTRIEKLTQELKYPGIFLASFQMLACIIDSKKFKYLVFMKANRYSVDCGK